MQKFDAIVLGNGILGMSTALQLVNSMPDLHIAVVGGSNRPGSATLAAGAMLGCFSEVTANMLSSIHGRTVLDIGVRAGKIWADWLTEINQCLPEQSRVFIQPGTFVVTNTETAMYEDENFAAILSALTNYNETFETVDPKDIPGLMPEERCRPLRSIFLPHEGSINPDCLLEAISIFLRQRNVVFIDDMVVDLVCSEEKIQHIITHKGSQLSADKILIAAGAYTQTLLDKIPSLSQQVPRVFAGLGCSAILRNTENKIPFPSVIRSPNRANACGVHMLPCDVEADYLYAGASNTGVFLPRTEPRIRDVYYLLKRTMEQINRTLHNKSLVNYKVGNRPVTMDTFPLIGKTSIDNLWILTGTYRIGIELAPVLSKFVAESMLDLTPTYSNLSIDLFTPERTLITTFTQQESKDEFAKQCFGTGYEHAMTLPKMGWEPIVMEAFCKRAEDIYLQLETNTSLCPDMLIMLEQNRELIPIFKTYLQKQDKLKLVAVT